MVRCCLSWFRATALSGRRLGPDRNMLDHLHARGHGRQVGVKQSQQCNILFLKLATFKTLMDLQQYYVNNSWPSPGRVQGYWFRLENYLCCVGQQRERRLTIASLVSVHTAVAQISAVRGWSWACPMVLRDRVAQIFSSFQKYAEQQHQYSPLQFFAQEHFRERLRQQSLGILSSINWMLMWMSSISQSTEFRHC